MFDYSVIDRIDTSGEAPLEEPMRQYYFMKKCKEWMEETKDRVGRELTLSMQTMGCQMNARDSEKFEAILTYIGYKTVDSTSADFVLYNTCTVRENANLKVYGRLGQLKNQKKRNPEMKIAMCGCMMQEPTVVEKIKKSYPYVDIIFGTHNVYKLAEILYTQIISERTIIDIWDEAKGIVEDLPSLRKHSFKAAVNIMYGCNNYCTYCIVPYVRGRERSRKPEEIIAEIKSLVADGVIEIMLLGQNVNSYGKTLDNPMSFAELLKLVTEIEGLKRIRFMTSHPKDLSDELIEVMASSDKICTQLHLPLQAGSTRILKKMNRVYTKESYLDLVDRIKSKLPNISLSTDIIVGFPGETDEDFEETMDVLRRVRYENVYSFIYSKRTGTPAATMDNQVPEDVIKERFDRMLELIRSISSEIADSRVGMECDILIEEPNDHDSTMVTGRMSGNAVVHCVGSKDLIGKIVRVKLLESKGFYYIGEIIND